MYFQNDEFKVWYLSIVGLYFKGKEIWPEKKKCFNLIKISSLSISSPSLASFSSFPLDTRLKQHTTFLFFKTQKIKFCILRNFVPFGHLFQYFQFYEVVSITVTANFCFWGCIVFRFSWKTPLDTHCYHNDTSPRGSEQVLLGPSSSS